MPIGVVIGPFSATPLRLIDSSVSSGRGVPASSITSTPACRTSHSKSTPVASRTRRAASVSSGPVPSPGISVTRWAMSAADRTWPRSNPPSGSVSRGNRWMSETTDFRPGLEGVVAVETEIAEPDREGGSLRYRGVDIEELVGHVPYENVWGLLVDDDLGSRMPDPEPYEPARADRERAGRSPGRDRAPRRGLGPRQAQRDLGRAGARGPRPPLGADDVDRRTLGASRRRPPRARLRRRRREGRDRRREVPAPLEGRGRSAGMPRRSTRTGSALQSTGSTRRRSPRGSSPPPARTAALRCRPRSARCPGRCTAARPPTSFPCSTRPRRWETPSVGATRLS